MKVLIVNSDSARNRGDRAILAGNIALVRMAWPEAEIWSFSENVARDEEWFGIRFLAIGIFSLNPLDFLRIAFFSRTCDVVFWGGGEILKDYTNRAALFFWWVKLACVRISNKNLYGAFQGVGATRSKLGQALIARMVDWTKVFLVRDAESAERLKSWGVETEVVASYDPAVLLEPERRGISECGVLLKKAGLSLDPQRPCIGIGVRRWFHYRQHGWIPFRWRQRFSRRHCEGETADVSPMEESLAELCDWLIDRFDAQVLFFPMHLAEAEADVDVALSIMGRMSHSQSAMCIRKDNLSPREYLDVMSCCRYFVGVRLHASILATAAGVPVMLFYYAEKGKRYFDQIGMTNMALPVDVLLEEGALGAAKEKMEELAAGELNVKRVLKEKVTMMRGQLCRDFMQWIGDRVGV